MGVMSFVSSLPSSADLEECLKQQRQASRLLLMRRRSSARIAQNQVLLKENGLVTKEEGCV